MAAIVSAQSGVSSATATWVGGVVPVEGDTVQTADTHTVTIDTSHIWGNDTATPALDILAGSTVDWDNLGNDVLTFKGDFKIRNGGTFNPDGTADGTKALALKLNYSAALAALKYGMIIENGSIISGQGFNKTRSWDTLSADAAAAQAVIVTTNNNSAKWAATDQIVCGTAETQNADGSELKVISEIVGTSITATTNWTYKHNQDCAVINLTRNITITAYNASYNSYITNYNQTLANLDMDWVAINEMGGNVALKYGITYATVNVCRGSWDNCSFYANEYFEIRFNTDNSKPNLTGNVSYLGMYGYSQFVGTTFTNCVGLRMRSSFIYNASGVIIDGCHIGNSLQGIISSGRVNILKGIIRIYGTQTGGTSSGLRINASITSDNNSRIYFDGCSQAIYMQAGASYLNGNVYFGTKKANTKDFYVAYPSNIYFKNSNTTTLIIDGNYAEWTDGQISVGTTTADHKTWKPYGTYERHSAVKYSGTSSFLLNPTNAAEELNTFGTIPAVANETVSYSCYCRKSVAMAVLPYIELSGCGVTAATTTMTNIQDTWVLLTVSGVAAISGFCSVKFACQNANGSVYFDDDPDSFKAWYSGDLRSVPLPSLTADDVWNKDLSVFTIGAKAGNQLRGVNTNVKSLL